MATPCRGRERRPPLAGGDWYCHRPARRGSRGCRRPRYDRARGADGSMSAAGSSTVRGRRAPGSADAPEGGAPGAPGRRRAGGPRCRWRRAAIDGAGRGRVQRVAACARLCRSGAIAVPVDGLRRQRCRSRARRRPVAARRRRTAHATRTTRPTVAASRRPRRSVATAAGMPPARARIAGERVVVVDVVVLGTRADAAAPATRIRAPRARSRCTARCCRPTRRTASRTDGQAVEHQADEVDVGAAVEPVRPRLGPEAHVDDVGARPAAARAAPSAGIAAHSIAASRSLLIPRPRRSGPCPTASSAPGAMPAYLPSSVASGVPSPVPAAMPADMRAVAVAVAARARQQPPPLKSRASTTLAVVEQPGPAPEVQVVEVRMQPDRCRCRGWRCGRPSPVMPRSHSARRADVGGRASRLVDDRLVGQRDDELDGREAGRPTAAPRRQRTRRRDGRDRDQVDGPIVDAGRGRRAPLSARLVAASNGSVSRAK